MGQGADPGDDEDEANGMYEQMIANQMAQEDDGEDVGEDDMIYDDEDFDAEQIFAQIGLTPE